MLPEPIADAARLAEAYIIAFEALARSTRPLQALSEERKRRHKAEMGALEATCRRKLEKSLSERVR